MNRSELKWMLDATLPHMGSTAVLCVVGLEIGNGSATAFATDRYTFGMATVDDDLPALAVNIPGKEARELLRFIRPTLVAHHEEDVMLLESEGELHVGIPGDSAVFELVPAQLTVDTFQDFYVRLATTPREWEQLVYQPSLFARFAKAQRDELDRLRLYPHRAQDKYGAALVTVGDHFMGAIAGLEYDQEGEVAA